MKPIYLISFLLLILNLQQCKKVENNSTNTPELLNEDSAFIIQKKSIYKPFIDSIIKKHNLNGIVRIGYKDQLVYEKANGYSNFEDSIKISEASTFAIASISKQFTAALILQLEQRKKLNLHDKVSLYLKEFKGKETTDITIRQLLNHRSGIVDHGKNLASQPGKEFNYSNKGYYYLQKIIEVINDEKIATTLNKWSREKKLKSIQTADEATDSLFAYTYVGTSKKPERVQNMPKRLLENNISIGAGGFITTSENLQIWNHKLFTGQLFASKQLKEFITKYSNRPHPILGTMGYGLGIMMNLEKPQCYFHSGYVKGAPSLNIYYPQSKISVIILSNFAEERLGKKVIFKPHLALKKYSDSVEAI